MVSSPKSKSKLSKTKKLGLITLLILLSAEIVRVLPNDYDGITIEEFYADIDEYVDVGEPVTFNWRILGNTNPLTIRIKFGDGTIKLIPGAGNIDNYTYSYTCEGKYNATLMVQEFEGDFYWQSVPELVIIKNDPPQISEEDVSFEWESIQGPFEDEPVKISVFLDDSPVDLKESVINYIYDFGDGKQTSSNKSFAFHNWSTAGNYPITVTAIDDQGALNKTTKFLNIINKAPEAKFTLGAGVPSTFSFSQDIIGSVPFRWIPSSSKASKVIKVIEEKDSHGKVLEVVANEELNSYNNYIETLVSNQDFGTVEYHFMTSNTMSSIGYLSLISGDELVLSIFTKNGFWYYQIPGEINKLNGIKSPENNNWHHVRFDFCIDDSGITPDSSCYGLKPAEFRVIVDGKEFVHRSLSATSNSISYVRIGAYELSLGKSYIDSVGFNWDENYNVGDNYQMYKPEYYATYDWRENVVGSNPYGWEAYNDDYPSSYEVDATYLESFEGTGNYWYLDDVDEQTIHFESTPTEDAHIDKIKSSTNFGNAESLSIEHYEWNYLQTFGIGAVPAPRGMYGDDNYWWVTGGLYNDYRVYIYNKQWQLQNSIFLGSTDIKPQSLSYYPSWIFILPEMVSWYILDVEGGNARVRVYDDLWNYWGYYSLSGEPDEIKKLYRTDQNWWIIRDGATRRVDKLDNNFGLVQSFTIDSQIGGYLSDVHWDGTYWWLQAGEPGESVYRFDQNWIYTGISYSLGGSDVISDIFYDGDHWWTLDFLRDKVMKYTRTHLTEAYLKKSIPYLTSDPISNSVLEIFVSSRSGNPNIDVYATSSFSEHLISWDQNRPLPQQDVYVSSKLITNNGWNSFNLGPFPSESYRLKLHDDSKFNGIKFDSSEYSDQSRWPKIHHYISKFNQSDGTVYCQTDITEKLSIRSPSNLKYNLRRGDKFEIRFKTTSSHDILFNLLKSEEIQESFIISEEGNSYYNYRTIYLYVSDDVSINQLEFTGLFDETNHLIIDYIKIYKGIKSDISIIDYGGDFGNVVQLRDRSWKNQLWMDNHFENQFSGTVEFWLQSNNIYDRTWFFSFWEDERSVFRIVMHENKWKYTFDRTSYNEIIGCGVPLVNEWHHIKVDFNKTTNEFNICIDNNNADPIVAYNFEAINKLRIDTAIGNEGTTMIDAIGFSWDDYYQIGDNKISLVNYPEKTNIQFSAADSIDTESDINSLRFYWDFGDGTSAFGKYVSHDYLTSGRYNVTLYCKDDNGEINNFTQIIQIYNLYPEVNLTSNVLEIVVNEGETIFFNAQSWDEITDFATLTYWWNFNVSNYNIFDFANNESDGWRKTHIYTDDFEGDAGVLVKDAEGAYNYDFIKVLVNNVDPLISIYDAKIISNISFEVFRSESDKFSNFSLELLANGQSQLSKLISFDNSNALSISSEEEQVIMTLSKNWEVLINSSTILPENSWFQYNIIFEYLNGETFTLSSGKIYGNEYGSWSVNLDAIWMNSDDFSFNQPLTFDGLIWDPSTDDINLEVSYATELIYEIECSNSLPISTSFVIEKPLGATSYEVDIYEDNNKMYASIKASQLFYSNYYADNQFPIELDISFTLYPIINLEEILQTHIGINNLNILGFIDSINYLVAEVMDDDGGQGDVMLEFKSILEIDNLSPNIELNIPTNGSLNKEVAFYVRVNDFNQFRSEYNTDSIDFFDDDVPIAEDFLFFNGTMTNEQADLNFQDDDFIILKPDHSYEEGIVFYDDFEDGIRDSNWTDNTNFGRIYEEDGVLKFRTYPFSIWGKTWRWFRAWAPYSTVPLSKFSRENWQVAVRIAYPTEAPKRHHYGLILYENDQNVWMFGPYDEGRIKIVKIIDKEMIACSEVVSNDTYLRIRKVNDIYLFEHSPDNETWHILEETSDLGINASDVGLFHRVRFFFGRRWVHFDDFVMKAPKETDYALNFTTKLHFDNLNNEYSLKNLKLLMDYKTDSNQLVNISIFNFASQSWDKIDSRYISDTNFNLNYPILSADYFNFENDLYVRIEAVNKSNDFRLYVDQLRLEYCLSMDYDYRLIKMDYEGGYVPNQLSENFKLLRGSFYQIGDLVFDDSSYSIFNSDYDSNEENEAVVIETKLNLEDANLYDKIESIELLLSLKTNISQLVRVNIFNFTSKEWIQIYSLSSVNFSPIIVPLNYIQDDFYPINEILIRIDAINESTSFNFSLNQLKLEYNYIPCYLLRTDNIFAQIGQVSDSSLMDLAGALSNEYFYTYWGSFIFHWEGEYLITIGINDGYNSIKNSEVFHAFNRYANSKIESMADYAMEDEMVYLSAQIESFGIFANETRYEWSFGDDTYAYTKNPTHKWSTSGIYNITLTVIDCFGNYFEDVKEIEVREKAPEILGPFTFYGAQGHAVVLDMEIFDSFLDEPEIKYEWYSTSSDLISEFNLFSRGKKPIVILNTGNYIYSLKVIDSSGYYSVANFSIEIEDLAPVALASSYCYLGNNKTYLEIKAFAYDSYLEGNSFDYEWKVHNSDEQYYNANKDTLYFNCINTTIYYGDVIITDSFGKSSIASFYINSFIDTDGNGYSDELERQLKRTGQTIYTDSDEDGLPNVFETEIALTDPLFNDTDGDGLLDGYNNFTGIGELTYGSDPNYNDSDNDMLLDGFEVFGWNITINSRTYLVTSNPVFADTDEDGLSDYEEFELGLDPRNTDTDSDGLLDNLDPFPHLYDGDGDGLSDYKEILLGTKVDSSDTDGDGLTDGQEVIGWEFITNPLTADSDHDFLGDNSETQVNKYKIDNRIELEQPVSLLFDEQCEIAASAQISFTLICEGMETESDQFVNNAPDLNVTIINDNNNLVIFNSRTNKSNVYSNVIDFKDTIESSEANYYGEYVIRINNTEAQFYLEQFEIEVVTYLNPNLDDYDGDSILDGVETNLLVKGKEIIDYNEMYSNSVMTLPIEEIGWWALDDGIGNNARDYSPFENHGVLKNTLSSQWNPGKVGDSSLYFDGLFDYIDCGNSTILNFERNTTFSFISWIKTTSSSDTILSRVDENNELKGYELELDNQGVVNVRIVNKWEENAIWVKGSTKINDDEWHLIVVTYDGSSNASGVKIFIDGNMDEPIILNDNLNSSIQTSVNFCIGSRFTNNYFTGYLDDIRIFDFVLSEADITWLNFSNNLQFTRTLNQDSEPEIEIRYALEIPQIGKVFDADLSFAFTPEDLLIGNGKIELKILKEELNATIENYVLYEAEIEYYALETFFYEDIVQIKPFIENSLIKDYYGKYILHFKISGTDSVDKFTLVDFNIETDTYIEAGANDQNAWITDPGTDDTDKDGWLDLYEIEITKTNPISDDTDGDGAIDPYDRDPKRDMMIQINPIYGIHRNLWFWEAHPLLQIIVTFELSGKDFYFCTTQKKGHVARGKSYFDGSYSSKYHAYYANFDDDMRTQGDIIDLNLQLWDMGPNDFFGNPLWDTRIVSASKKYTIGSDAVITAYQKGDFGHSNEMQIKINTFSIDKANTIAIYENGTIFNGHYQVQERMNIFQLYINEEVSEGPFVQGLNVIVIPTSLFTETVLNAKIQNKELQDTLLYKEGCSEFISINRSGEDKEACGDVDFVFVRYEISLYDAMQVLQLLRTCIINQTSGETAVAYNYASAQEYGYDPVMMNLPAAALGYVPWICNLENSAQGKTPRDFGNWLADKITAIVDFVVGIFVAIFEAFVTFWEAIVEFVGDILMAVIPFLADLIWLLVRAAILIVVYISFALSLLMVGGFLLILIPFGLIMTTLFGFSASFVNLEITTQRNEVFDLVIPVILLSFGGTSGSRIILGMSFFTYDVSMTEPVTNENPLSSTKAQEKHPSSSTLKSSKTNEGLITVEMLQNRYFIEGWAIAMSFIASFMAILGVSAVSSGFWAVVGVLISLGLMVYAIYKIVEYYRTLDKANLILFFKGLALGFLLSNLAPIIVLLLAHGKTLEPDKLKSFKRIKILVSILSFVVAALGFALDVIFLLPLDNPALMAQKYTALGFGFAALIVSTIVLILFTRSSIIVTRKKAALVTLLFTLFCTFLTLTILEELEQSNEPIIN